MFPQQNIPPFLTHYMSEWTKTRKNAPYVFDVPTMMDSLRKNIQTVATAQQMYIDSLQVVARAQGMLLSDLANGQGDLARSMADSEAPEDKIGDQALIVKYAYERFQAHFRELQDMMYQSNREAGAMLSRRVGHSLAEMKDAIDRAKQNRAA